MTQTKAKHMKDSMCQEFGMIFQLCQMVLENSQNASLVVVTLETLLRFMHWIPLGYIFETNLIQSLVTRFLSVPAFRNVTLKCLAEIGRLIAHAIWLTFSAGVPAKEYSEKVVELFIIATNKLNEVCFHSDQTTLLCFLDVAFINQNTRGLWPGHYWWAKLHPNFGHILFYIFKVTQRPHW